MIRTEKRFASLPNRAHPSFRSRIVPVLGEMEKTDVPSKGVANVGIASCQLRCINWKALGSCAILL